jgi:hypothetical protein
MPRRERPRKQPEPAPFDVGYFLEALEFHPYPFGPDNGYPEITWLYSNGEFVFFGRRGEELIYSDVGDWDDLDQAMHTWPHVAIAHIWRTHPCPHGEPIEQPYLILETAVPWPTSFDEAFAAMVRWDLVDEHQRRTCAGVRDRATEGACAPRHHASVTIA